MTTRNLVVNEADRAPVGCFAGCARALSHFRSRVYFDSRSIDGFAVVLVRVEAHSSALGAVRPAEGVKRIGQSGGEVEGPPSTSKLVRKDHHHDNSLLQAPAAGAGKQLSSQKASLIVRPPAALLYIPLDQSLSFSSWWSSFHGAFAWHLTAAAAPAEPGSNHLSTSTERMDEGLS